MIVEVIHPTLHNVYTKLIWDSKLETETLKDYLFRQISPPSNSNYKKIFDKGQIEKIDSNPQCNEFDISLYFSCISLSAEYNCKMKSSPTLVDEVKEKLRQVKCIRNNIFHNPLELPEAKIHNYANEMKVLMTDFLDLIGNIFGCRTSTDAQKIIVHRCIDGIMATQQKDYENTFLYVVSSLLLLSAMMNLKNFIWK
ncbi:unnamed protein product [Meganyctiphanes norvegica]|uniref:DZIP3-like HEPN domain-containing protein n=1 Tax=Meganyctiphanes norvegica TaxID=48144 RepID=A0AAV2QCC9_MEGNR